MPASASRPVSIHQLASIQKLDQAMPAATGKLGNPSDKALAHNNAANVLRWMTALDPTR